MIVALTMTIILGATALGIDWGYGLNARRIMQNTADAGALAAGKYMAQNVAATSPTAVGFRVTQEQVWCEAQRVAVPNRQLAPPQGATLAVEFGAGNPPTYPAAKSNVADCSTPASATQIPANTTFVRVSAGVTYTSLIGRPTTSSPGTLVRPSITAIGSARVRLSGNAIDTAGPALPMVRHFDPREFQCTAPCSNAFEFWSSNGAGAAFGSFKGAVDFSRYSQVNYDPAAPKPQLITDYDHRPNITDTTSGGPLAQCPSKMWKPAGNQNQDQCSIPGWFAYSFTGVVSLTADRTGTVPNIGPRTHDDNAPGKPFDNKNPIVGACTNLPPYFPAPPSCAAGHYGWGDWVEVAQTGGAGDGKGFGDLIQSSPNSYLTPRSYQKMSGTGTCADPINDTSCYGKALLANIYLWDCAEDTDSNGNWGLVYNDQDNKYTDCSAVNSKSKLVEKPPALNPGNTKPARVHILTVVPFTFYHGLANSSDISGFWGGELAPQSCNPTCAALNPFSNSAALDGE